MSRHHLAPALLAAFGLALVLGAQAADTIVDDTNTAISYSATTDVTCSTSAYDEQCANMWWTMSGDSFEGKTARVTYGPSASFSYSFQSSSITLLGSSFPSGSGAQATVVLDNSSPSIIDFDSTTGATSRVDNVVLFSQNGLNEGITHTISVSFDTDNYNASEKLRFMAIDAIALGSYTSLLSSTVSNIVSSSGTIVATGNSESTASRQSTQTTITTSSSTTSSTTARASSGSSGFGTGKIAAIAASASALLLVLSLGLFYCVRSQKHRSPRRIKPSSHPRASVLGSTEKGELFRNKSVLVSRLSFSGAGNGAAAGIASTVVIAAAVPLGRGITMKTPRRSSMQAQRPDSPEPPEPPSLAIMSPPADMLSPNTSAPPDSAFDSPSPSSAAPLLRQPRRVPAPLPLSHSNINATGSSSANADNEIDLDAVPEPGRLHPHAAPTPLGSPRLAEWMQTVVIPPTPPANREAPPAYTPRSGKKGRSPRTLADLQEKMSPAAWTPSARSPGRR